MKRIVTMMLCLIGMAASMNAQTITGKLVDEKNEPLAYANVVLLSTLSRELEALRLHILDARRDK